MRRALLWILISTTLSVSSQTLTTDPATGTVTISKDQAIILANIVQNEKRLGHFLDSLRVELRVLSDSIQGYVDRAAEARKRLQDIQFRNDTLRLELAELEKQREIPLPPPKGFYLWLSADNGVPEQRGNIFLGALYLYDKFIIAGGVDPFVDLGPTYTLGVGLKLF